MIIPVIFKEKSASSRHKIYLECYQINSYRFKAGDSDAS